MSKMIDIISRRKGIIKKSRIKYVIDKHLLWNTYVKKVIDDICKEDLTYEKINDFIFFLQSCNYNYNDYGYVINYKIDKDYKLLEIKDTEYILKIVLYNVLETADIDFSILCSNTTYSYTIPDNRNKKFRGCVYDQLHDNINNTLNNTMRDIFKQYILKKNI